MADKKETFLKPIKTLCQKFEENNEVSDCVKELKKLIEKGDFYEYHTFDHLLSLLKVIPKSETQKQEEIINVLDFILQKDSKIKKTVVTAFYNYIINLEKHSHLQKSLFEICRLPAVPKKETLEIYLYITDFFTRYPDAHDTQSKRALINSNFCVIFKFLQSNDKLMFKFWQYMNRISKNYFAETKKWNNTIELLTAITDEIGKNNDKCLDEDSFKEYLKLINFLTTYGENLVLQSTLNLVNVMRTLSKSDEHRTCNEILSSCLEMYSQEYMTAAKLSQFCALLKSKKIEKQDSACIETISMISGFLVAKQKKLESTSEAFESYHQMIYALYHVLRLIKNEANILDCCTDIKRHRMLKLAVSTIGIAENLINEGVFDAAIANALIYHIKYASQICCDLKCKSKSAEQRGLYLRLFNFFVTLSKHEATILENMKSVCELAKILLSEWKSLSEEFKVEKLIPIPLLVVLFEKTKYDTSLARYIALGNAMIYFQVNSDVHCVEYQERKFLMKRLWQIRSASQKSNCTTATEFFEKYLKSEMSKNNVSLNEILVLEILAISRYDNDNDAIGSLFNRLLKKNDLESFSRACPALTVLNNIDIIMFKELNDRLEWNLKQSAECDVEKLLAVANNNYLLFKLHEQKVLDEISKLKNEEEKTAELLKMVKIKDEFEIIGYLEQALTSYSQVYCMMCENKVVADKILSKTKFFKILDNISGELYDRGLYEKSVEARVLFLNYVVEEKLPIYILNNASILIQNEYYLKNLKIDQRIKLKNIQDILNISLTQLDTFMKNFTNESKYNQATIIFYLLNLWSYCSLNGKEADGSKYWKYFKRLFDVTKIDDLDFKFIIEGKIYYEAFEINLKRCKRTCIQFLNCSMLTLCSVKKISADFSHIFRNVYHSTLLQIMNLCINRQADLDISGCTVVNFKNQALRKAHLNKYFEYLLISILRFLNMEKIDKAKAELQEVTSFLGIDESIFTQIPSKKALEIDILEQELQGLTIRKDASSKLTSLKSKPSFELISSEDSSTELLLNIKSIIHERNCKCEICQYPRMKFFMFQICCYYSRLMWLMNKFEASDDLNRYTFSIWRDYKQTILSLDASNSIATISKDEFVKFSIRWLIQVADTHIKMEKYFEAKEIYHEIESICTSDIEDYACQKQHLQVRLVNIDHFIKSTEQYDFATGIAELSFEEFIKRKKVPVKIKKSPAIASTSKKVQPLAQRTQKNKEESVIFLDTSDDCLIVEAPKPPKKSEKTPSASKTVKKVSDKPTRKGVKKLSQDEPSNRPVRITRRML